MTDTLKLRNERKTYTFDGPSLEEIGKQVDSFEVPEGFTIETMEIDHETYTHRNTAGQKLARVTHWYATISVEKEYYDD